MESEFTALMESEFSIRCTDGVSLCVFTEAALHVSRVQMGPPVEAVEKQFNATCGLGSLC
jgi:hypothetical protein